MILFFDRDTGTSLPLATRLLVPRGVTVKYHQEFFPQDARDDAWMKEVGEWGWTVIGHDDEHLKMPAELAVIKQHNVGCFYLWGHNKPKMHKMEILAKAFQKIVSVDEKTPKPFVFRIDRYGRLRQLRIP